MASATTPAPASSAPTPRDAGPPVQDSGVLPIPRPDPPDPLPLRTQKQWVLSLSYRSGVVRLTKVEARTLPKPVDTARNMGRFAVELFVGPELVDRVRFNFPLLGTGQLPKDEEPWSTPPSFEQQVSSAAQVVIPDSDRVVRASLLDRATGQRWALGWPPAASSAPLPLVPQPPPVGSAQAPAPPPRASASAP